MSVAKTIADMLAKSTDRWAKQRKAEIRDRSAFLRRADRMSRRERPLKQTEASIRLMRSAYMTASANGTLPAKSESDLLRRSARDAEADRVDVDQQQLFHPDALDRFHARQSELDRRLEHRLGRPWPFPRTAHREIGLGTLAVRSYIARLRNMAIRSAGIFSTDVSTMGPSGR